jgi:cyclic pyranopterin phosphate synthase
MISFEVLSVNVSPKKGEVKIPVKEIKLKKDHGIEGDAHAGPWHRQVSLLAQEDIDTIKSKGLKISYGDFAENITTRGIDLASLPIGARLCIGSAELEVTQIGKKCHKGCAIFQQIGDCVMPRKGIFTRVIKGGLVNAQSTGSYNIG